MHTRAMCRTLETLHRYSGCKLQEELGVEGKLNSVFRLIRLLILNWYQSGDKQTDSAVEPNKHVVTELTMPKIRGRSRPTRSPSAQ